MRSAATRRRALRWLWLLLLPLPSFVGYAGSGDPIGTMSQISNRAAKGDRLPFTHSSDAGSASCAPARLEDGLVCPARAGDD